MDVSERDRARDLLAAVDRAEDESGRARAALAVATLRLASLPERQEAERAAVAAGLAEARRAYDEAQLAWADAAAAAAGVPRDWQFTEAGG